MGYHPVNTLMVLFEVYATLENVHECGIGRVRTAYPIKEPRLICKYLNLYLVIFIYSTCL